MNRYFINISYDGTRYHGWQIQNNGITIQEVFTQALSTFLQHKVDVIGCGRTDSGVHASSFFVHFDTGIEIQPLTFVYRMNRLLPWDISVLGIRKVHKDAHTRFDALSRMYEYKIHSFKDPFSKNKSYFFPSSLNVDKMNEACNILKIHKDFTSFSKLHTQVKTNFCEIVFSKWIKNKNQLIFRIEANRFLRNMVRAVVGTMIEIGQEKITVEDFEKIIKSKNRSNAGMSVPACGLYLVKITYPFEVS